MATNNAGYGIDIKISPDGQFLASGDSGGYVCFWDWKKEKCIISSRWWEGGWCYYLAGLASVQETSKVTLVVWTALLSLGISLFLLFGLVGRVYQPRGTIHGTFLFLPSWWFAYFLDLG